MSKKPLIWLRIVFIRRVFLAALFVMAGAGVAPELRAQGDRGGTPGDFDYYLLSLSWSPTYCASREENGGARGGNDGQYGDERGYGGRSGGGERRDYGRRNDGDQQCTGIRPYAFVLHGLWPQYERKGWPEFCRTGSQPWVSEETIGGMMDIMPSRRLVIHEYKKHGVCSGLDPRGYFDAARRAYRNIRIPDRFQDLSQPLTVSPEDVRKTFLEANRQLPPDSIQIACSRHLLREVRVCLTKDLAPRPCSQTEQNRPLCGESTVTMPPVRGGGTGPRGGPSFNRGDNL
jgi:ribonuclease T2